MVNLFGFVQATDAMFEFVDRKVDVNVDVGTFDPMADGSKDLDDARLTTLSLTLSTQPA